MEARWQQYKSVVRHARKRLSEAQRRSLAANQKYCCVGPHCQGTKHLPHWGWEVDHIVPLFMGGNNDFQLHEDGSVTGNFRVLCARCHRTITHKQRVDFYEQERKHKYGDTPTFIPASKFYAKVKPKPFLTKSIYPVIRREDFLTRHLRHDPNASSSSTFSSGIKT